jgi:hypothetical protein
VVADPFVTPEQLVTYLDEDIDEERAELLLRAVSDEIRDALGWSVTAESGVSATLDGSGTDLVVLPTRRLTAVTVVEEDGRLLAGPADYMWYRSGMLRRVSGGRAIRWTRRPQGVTVVFDHGYPPDEVPGVFATVVYETAAGLLANPGSAVRSRTVGRVAVTYAEMRKAVGPVDDPRLDHHRVQAGF